MRGFLPVLGVLVCLAPTALSQAPNATVCVGLNHQTGSFQPFVLTTPDTFACQVISSHTAGDTVIDRVELHFPAVNTGGTILLSPVSGVLEIRDHDYATGLPSATVIASTTTGTVTGPIFTLAGGWTGGTFSSPVTLFAFTPYWVTFRRTTTTATTTLGFDAFGPDPAPYTVLSGGGWGPVTTGYPKVRLSAFGVCVPSGPTATITNVGTGSTGTGGFTPALTTTGGPPTLGNASFNVQLTTPLPNQQVMIFIATFADPVGTPIAPGVNVHLDVPSLYWYIVQGFNPLFTGSSNASGVAPFNFYVPSDPGFAGTLLAFQGLVLDPGGLPLPGVGGMALSQALEMRIGY